jgi:CheY-like chemotaxis protein
MAKQARGRPTIVVIDDSASVRLFFERSVDGFDVALQLCGSAEEALEVLSRSHPDLIFLDIIMPDKDGLTFLQELRRLPGYAETPVVVISSKDYAQDKMTAKELGASDFVIKPMSTKTIQDLIAKYTEARARC